MKDSPFRKKSLTLFFVSQNLNEKPKFKIILKKRDTIAIKKITFGLKFEIQGKFLEADLNILTFDASITAFNKTEIEVFISSSKFLIKVPKYIKCV